MPVPFPTRDPDHPHALVTVDYYTVEEAADLLHVSVSTLRAKLAEGRWPCLELVSGRRYMSADHIADVIDLSTHGVPAIPEAPPTLGVPVSDADTEGIR